MKLPGLFLALVLFTASVFAAPPQSGLLIGRVMQVIKPGTVFFNGGLWVPATAAERRELGQDKVAADIPSEMVVEGVPETLVDRNEWSGHVAYEGIRQLRTVLGATKTVHVFRVVAPAAASKPKPGSWMYEK